MAAGYPSDSADARELRERESDDMDQPHVCRNGWTGEDDNGRPIPCRVCRPHVSPCQVCGTRARACWHRRLVDGSRCCDGCTHTTRKDPKR